MKTLLLAALSLTSTAAFAAESPQQCYRRVLAEYCDSVSGDRLTCKDSVIYGVGQRQAHDECAAAKGKVILTCSATDGDYVELRIYANPDGSVRASVTEESVGGSYPTFHYKIRKAGPEGYFGEGFALRLVREGQAKLTIDDTTNEMGCR